MDDKSQVPLLSVERLKKYYMAKSGMFSRNAGVVRAVDGVSFQLFERETLGLVGESGCGKSTLGRQLVGLEHPTGGRVVYDGNDLGNMSQAQMKPFRTQLQMIFQDSYSSLNPRKHVFEILSEPMLYHGLAKRGDVYSHVEKLLDMVGLLRRTEAAHRHCQGPFPKSQAVGMRRTGQRSGRVHPGPDTEPAQGFAEGAGTYLYLYRPRPGSCELCQRPDCRHVPGEDCRDCRPEGAV